MKELSKIISEFEKFPYESCERMRHKHEPTDNYFYLARQVAKFMMRDDTLNAQVYPVRTEINYMQQIPISHVCSMDESGSEGFLVDENILQFCSTNKDKSKNIIVDEISTEESESECFHINKNKEKYEKDERYHKENTITYDAFIKEPIYVKIFECGNNLLKRLDATCK